MCAKFDVLRKSLTIKGETWLEFVRGVWSGRGGTGLSFFFRRAGGCFVDSVLRRKASARGGRERINLSGSGGLRHAEAFKCGLQREILSRG